MTDLAKDPDWLRLAFDVLQLVGVIALGIWTWWVNTHKGYKEADERQDGFAKSLAGRLSKVEVGLATLLKQGLPERLAKIETSIEHVPTSQDVKELHARVVGVEEMAKASRDNTALILQHLVNKGSK